MTFHWNRDLKLPKVYGFPKSEWGVAFIILSDYMLFTESQSKTVITCTITYTNIVSSNIGKTANQCATAQEVINEAFTQLKQAFPNLPDPTVSLLSPEMSYNSAVGKWETTGKAFVTSSDEGYLPFSGKIPNLFNLGTQNGEQTYKFTSLESAVTNSIVLAHTLDPELRKVYKLESLFSFSRFIWVILLVIILIIIYTVAINKK